MLGRPHDDMDLAQSGHLYLPCECCNYGAHGFFVEVLHWTSDEINFFEVGLRIHCGGKDSLWRRLRWAWRVLRGREYDHEIMLSEAQALQLRDFIENHWKILRWRIEDAQEKANDATAAS